MVSNYRFVFFLIPILISSAGCITGQELPVKQIPQIVVESNRKFFSEDQATLSISLESVEAIQSLHIGQVLQKNSSVDIRQYGGAGSLTSVNIHGTGSNHTQVTWNGIPINSPTTGQVDLSLIPSGFMQTIEVITGASGSVFGSGTFGGAINLSNEPDWKNRISASYSLYGGSFGLRRHNFTLQTGNKRIQYHLAAITTKSDNDFSYRDRYLSEYPKVKNQHNAYQDIGILQNVFVNLNKENNLEAGAWYQYKDLELPALMGSYAPSFARQKDSVFRSYINFRKTGSFYTMVISSAYFSDFLNYTNKHQETDSMLSIDSRIKTSRLMNDAEIRFYITPKFIVGGGFAFNSLLGKSNNYERNIHENEYAVYGNAKYVYKALIVNAGFRKEFYKYMNPLPQFSVGIRYKMNDRLILRTSVSSKFRKPTFNEKYWKPGGNPDLRPEKGWGGELTIETDIAGKKDGPLLISARISGYFQSVDNWIQWVIRDSLTPVEYKQVHSTGMEAWLNYRVNMGLLKLIGHINYDYNRSVIIKTFDNNTYSEGNQMMYVPRNVYSASCRVIVKDYCIGFSMTHTGIRETIESADPSLRLPSYTVFDCVAGFHRKIKSLPLSFSFGIDNLLNNSYEVIRSYPQPGRTCYFTIRAGIDKKETQH
jgi:outer membrane cobalamin receptor